MALGLVVGAVFPFAISWAFGQIIPIPLEGRLLIIKLQRKLKVTSIVLTHDMNSAMKIADRIVMLFEGKIVFDGTPAQLQASTEPRVKQFVSGEASDQDLEAIRESRSPAPA